MAVDLAEIFFLTAGKEMVAAGERESKEQAEVEESAAGGDKQSELSNLALADECGCEEGAQRKQGTAAGGEESQGCDGSGEIHITVDAEMPHSLLSTGGAPGNTALETRAPA